MSPLARCQGVGSLEDECRVLRCRPVRTVASLRCGPSSQARLSSLVGSPLFNQVQLDKNHANWVICWRTDRDMAVGRFSTSNPRIHHNILIYPSSASHPSTARPGQTQAILSPAPPPAAYEDGTALTNPEAETASQVSPSPPGRRATKPPRPAARRAATRLSPAREAGADYQNARALVMTEGLGAGIAVRSVSRTGICRRWEVRTGAVLGPTEGGKRETVFQMQFGNQVFSAPPSL